MGVGETNMKDFKLQPMKCELNFLSKSDGSALLSQGETVVLASVNGPLDIKMQSQSIEKATLEVLFNSKGGKPSVADRYKENIIRQTCESAILGSMFPRTGITVTVQELEDYGGLLACCVNCVCLALLNSGVSMRNLFAAVTCSLDKCGEVMLQPARFELESARLKENCVCVQSDRESGQHDSSCVQHDSAGGSHDDAVRATMCFVFDSRDKSLITGFTAGSFSEAAYLEALERCRAASDLVFGFYREAISQYCGLIG